MRAKPGLGRGGRLAVAAGLGMAIAACATPPASPPAPPPPVAGSAALPSTAGSPAAPARLVLVAIDGLVPSDYLNAPGAKPVMPTLAELAATGVAVESVEPVFPPDAHPADTTLVTGRIPARHGIVADRRLGDHGVRSETFDHASLLKAPTLWQAVSEAHRRVATLDWPVTGGANVAALLPDGGPRRPGESWAAFLTDNATPWIVDLAQRSGADTPAAARPGPEHDAVLTEVACHVLTSSTPPDLVLMRLSQTEPALRRFGPDAPETRAAFAGADHEIGRLVRCLGTAGRLAETAIVVAGDHGFLPVHTAVRPNVFLAQAGLVTPESDGSIVRWDALARSNGGTAFVYARSSDLAVLARQALSAAAKRTGLFHVLSASDMLALGGDPQAWFGIAADPGVVFEDAAIPPGVGPAAARAAGGYPPSQRAMRTGLVAWGRGFRARLRVPVLRQVDVAPTLARLLGVSLGDADDLDGHPIVGILRGPAGRMTPKIGGSLSGASQDPGGGGSNAR